MTKEQQERFTLFHKRIALSLTKNKQITWKTDERIPNPAKEKRIANVDLFFAQLKHNFAHFESLK